jgi:hypothetical protein
MTAKDYYRRISRRKRLNRFSTMDLLCAYMRESGILGEWSPSFVDGDARTESPHCRYTGHCAYDSKIIWITTWAIEHNTPAQLRDVILHEIAHALVGPDTGHGVAWREQALALGMRPAAVLNALLAVEHIEGRLDLEARRASA